MLTAVWVTSSPVRNIAIIVDTTLEGAGKNLVSMKPKRAQSSHKTRSASGEITFNRRSRVRADIFGAACDLVEIVCTLMISSPPPDGARPRERHWLERLHLPRLRRHDHDAIAQKYRLVDRMGDEHHGLLVLLPDVQQLLLQQELVLRIERRERLVHQQNFGIVGEGARDRHALAHTAAGGGRAPGQQRIVDLTLSPPPFSPSSTTLDRR